MTEEKDTGEITKVDQTKIAAKKKGELVKSRFHFIFTVIQGSDADFGKNFIFLKDSVTFGRSKENDIVVNDEKVSKNHCQVNILRNIDMDQIVLVDLQSTNGTYLNGNVVKQKILKSGDKIEIGDTIIRFGYTDEVEQKYHSRLFNFAVTDSLTGLYNKRYILNELESQCKIAKRNKRIFSIIIFDVDNFKQINDTHGHLAGDEYLKKLAYAMGQVLREQDISSRFGGEEFLIILAETPLEGAMKVAERLRGKIEALEISYAGKIIKTTISAGISQFQFPAFNVHVLIKAADDALLEAKRSGKNRAKYL